MSAWRIGTEAANPSIRLMADQPAWKQYVDRLVKYIPGDALGGYTAAITLFLLKDGAPNPTLWLAILFTAVAAALVITGWRLTPNRSRFPTIVPDLVLAVIAFVAWSLTVPGNGWTELAFIANNPGIAGLVGLLAGIFIPRLARIFGRE